MSTPEASVVWLNALLILDDPQIAAVYAVMKYDAEWCSNDYNRYRTMPEKMFDRAVVIKARYRWDMSMHQLEKVVTNGQHAYLKSVSAAVSNFSDRTMLLSVKLMLSYQQAAKIDNILKRLPAPESMTNAQMERHGMDGNRMQRGNPSGGGSSPGRMGPPPGGMGGGMPSPPGGGIGDNSAMDEMYDAIAQADREMAEVMTDEQYRIYKEFKKARGEDARPRTTARRNSGMPGGGGPGGGGGRF